MSTWLGRGAFESHPSISALPRCDGHLEVIKISFLGVLIYFERVGMSDDARENKLRSTARKML
jgi:hypothetical protein